MYGQAEGFFILKLLVADGYTEPRQGNSCYRVQSKASEQLLERSDNWGWRADVEVLFAGARGLANAALSQDRGDLLTKVSAES